MLSSLYRLAGGLLPAVLITFPALADEVHEQCAGNARVVARVEFREALREARLERRLVRRDERTLRRIQRDIERDEELSAFITLMQTERSGEEYVRMPRELSDRLRELTERRQELVCFPDHRRIRGNHECYPRSGPAVRLDAARRTDIWASSRVIRLKRKANEPIRRQYELRLDLATGEITRTRWNPYSQKHEPQEFEGGANHPPIPSLDSFTRDYVTRVCGEAPVREGESVSNVRLRLREVDEDHTHTPRTIGIPRGQSAL